MSKNLGLKTGFRLRYQDSNLDRRTQYSGLKTLMQVLRLGDQGRVMVSYGRINGLHQWLLILNILKLNEKGHMNNLQPNILLNSTMLQGILRVGGSQTGASGPRTWEGRWGSTSNLSTYPIQQ